MNEEIRSSNKNILRGLTIFIVGISLGIALVLFFQLFYDALMRNRVNAFSEMNITKVNEQLSLLAKAIENNSIHDFAKSDSLLHNSRHDIKFSLVSEHGVLAIYDERLKSSMVFIPYYEGDEIKWLCLAGSDGAAGWGSKCRIYYDGTELFGNKAFAVSVRKDDGSIISSVFGKEQ